MMTRTPSQRIRARLVVVEPTLSAASLRIAGHPDAAALFPRYMITMHGISRAAVPLMEAAAERARELGDATSLALAGFLERLAPEEAGHDDWLVEDLRSIGYAGSVADEIPDAAVAALVGAQYYWIRHVDPIALLGYLSVMEANPPTDLVIDRLRERTGFPASAFRSMRLHAQLDVEHREEVNRAIDELVGGGDQEILVARSALHTAEGLADVLIGLVDAHDAAHPAVAGQGTPV